MRNAKCQMKNGKSTQFQFVLFVNRSA